MKINFRKKAYQLWAIFSIFLIVFSLVLIYFFIRDTQESIDFTLNKNVQNFEGEINATIESYELFSNYIYYSILEDETVMKIINEANSVTDDRKDELREELYNLLYEEYILMESFEFRQLHFHLPNTESFLRFHRPDKYGDILIEARESVRIVNENEEYISGFEEGRIYNGYRFVYPLLFENELIGSVEVSISMGSVIEVISKQNPDCDYLFIIKKDIVEEKVFESQLENYSDTILFENFYFDNDVNIISDKYNTIINDFNDSFIEKLKIRYSDNLSTSTYVEINEYKDEDFAFIFIPIKNFKNESVAYLVSVSRSLEYKELSSYLSIEIMMVVIIVVIIILAGFIFTALHEKLKSKSERDYLTGIYSRKKFYELSEMEFKIMKRYEYNIAVLMMDIDHFKKINDTFGHNIGDEVLKNLSEIVSKSIRSSDVLARWGGEEFVLLLPRTNKEGAIAKAEQIRKIIDSENHNHMKDVTVSIGISMVQENDDKIDLALVRADVSMYQAKKNGRNRVYLKE